MRNIKIFKLLLMLVAALTIGSCDDNEDSDSVITSFTKFPVLTNHTTVVTPEGDEEVIVFKFAFNGEAQVNDMVVEIGVASTSTATEDVDFSLSAHEIEVPAYAGQDTVSVEVHILQDGEVEDEDESIYLTLKASTPSGLEQREIHVATIEDSGVRSNVTVEFDWDKEVQSDAGSFNLADSTDLDFYLYNEDGDEVTGFEGATGSHPEGFDLPGDLENGTYEIWVNFWNRAAFEDLICTDVFGNEYNCVGSISVPLSITYTRGSATQTIDYPVIGQTYSEAWYEVNSAETNDYVEFYVGAIEVTDGVFTFYNLDDENVGTLRKMTSRSATIKRKK